MIPIILIFLLQVFHCFLSEAEVEHHGSHSDSIPPNMVFIPGGKLVMGLSDNQRIDLAKRYEVHPDLFGIQTHREVDVSPFYIDKYEVTNRQYRAFIQATGHQPPPLWLDYGYIESLADCPVTGVLYEDTLAYTQWIGKRLPTEEEWELAARGTDGRLWPWGDTWDASACKHDNAGQGPLISLPAPVGSHPKDQSVYGVMDVAGNVTEWVDAPRPPEVKWSALVKGGSFFNSKPYLFLCSTRLGQPKPNGHVGFIGFRCAMDVPSDGSTPDHSSESLEAQITNEKLSSMPNATAQVEEVPKTLLEPAPPVPDLYRSKPIQFIPVWNPPGGEEMSWIYLFHRVEPEQALAENRPYRLEIRVPYLPDDRFDLLFENFWTHPHWEPRFNEDFTRVEFTEAHGSLEVLMRVQGGLDTVDIEFSIKNNGAEATGFRDCLCFRSLHAPNFADHNGDRTFIMTDQGPKPMTQMWHHTADRQWQINNGATERLWMQMYDPGEKDPDSETGPTVMGPFLATVSRDGNWVVAPVPVSGPAVWLFNNREYSCLHVAQSVQIEPGEEKRIKHRLYFIKDSMEGLVARASDDIKKTVQKTSQ